VNDTTEQLFQKVTADGLIEVLARDQQRFLYIDGIEQTRIDIQHPESLDSLLHRYLLSALLFIDTPQTVLLGGLGGGALARYLHNRMPGIVGDAIEINKTVAQLAKTFFFFPEKWDLQITDIQQWHKRWYDLILIDIAEAALTPGWLISETMLMQWQHQLSLRGVLVIDLLVDDAQSFTEALQAIRKVFKQRTLCLTVPGHKNIVVLAFNQVPEYSTLQVLNKRVEPLIALWGVEFSAIIEQLKNDNPADTVLLKSQ